MVSAPSQTSALITLKYEVYGLSSLAKHKIHRACLRIWDTDEVLDAVEYLYPQHSEETLEAKDLRPIVRATIARRPASLFSKERIQELLSGNGVMGYELMKKMEEMGRLKDEG